MQNVLIIYVANNLFIYNFSMYDIAFPYIRGSRQIKVAGMIFVPNVSE